MSLSTITLQTVVNLCRTHADLVPLAGIGGYTDEPALSLCNDTIEEALASPNSYKFNRAEMPPFVTAVNKQDYIVSGAVGFTLGSNSTGAPIGLSSTATKGISRSGTTVTVTFLEAHRMSVGDTLYMLGNGDSQFNSTFTNNGQQASYSGGWVILTTPSTTTLTFTHATSGTTTSGAPGITDFGWLESGTVTELNNNSAIPNLFQLIARSTLTPSRMAAGTPDKVCVLKDNGDGTLTVRFREILATTIWTVNLVYQKSAPLKTALSDTWAPFPDSFSYVVRQGFLARGYRYINSPRADAEDAKFQRAIQKAIGQGDVEPTDQSVIPETSLLDGQYNCLYW
jgi:hypothetical protein